MPGESAGEASVLVGAPAPVRRGVSMDPPDVLAEVVLTGPDGLPVTGADVVLYEDTPGRHLGFDPPPARASGRTGDSGSVLLPIAPSRRHMIRISHPGFPTLVDVECFGGNVTPGRTARSRSVSRYRHGCKGPWSFGPKATCSRWSTT